MANPFGNFLEKIFIKFVPKNSDYSELPIVSPDESLASEILKAQQNKNGSGLADTVTSENISEPTLEGLSRECQYERIDSMVVDSRISTVLTLYADDATQYNNDGNVIWATSSNPDIQKFANKLITELNLNKNAWGHIYKLCKYGNLYLELFKGSEKTQTVINDELIQVTNDLNISPIKMGDLFENYIEDYADPARILDLTLRGKTVAYVVQKQQQTENNQSFYTIQGQDDNKTVVAQPNKFIHIYLAANTRFPEYRQITINDKETTCRVQEGESVLANAYNAYRTVKLLEDTIIMNRVTKSSINRVIQIEVGDMSVDDVSIMQSRLKECMTLKTVENMIEGTYTSLSSPGPLENTIFLPTKNGKGELKAFTIGGDVNIKDLADLDYYVNKLYGALAVPKAALGADMEGSGLGNGSSLTKLDSMYSRRVKRVQTSYISGITTLLNILAIDKGLEEYVGAFTVEMVSPATVEDSERNDDKITKVGILSDMLDILDDSLIDAATRKNIIVKYFNTDLCEEDIALMVKNDKTIAKDILEPGDSEDGSSEFGGSDLSGSISPSPSMGSNPDFSSPLDDETDDTDINSDNSDSGSNDEPDDGVDSSEGFGDFESEY